ncbi:MAG: type II secretion system F family protein [Candidatus Melainabacteria bacterium]|nr:type II secretion system F family protein [Candidatus Melainabacteria bacterium]
MPIIFICLLVFITVLCIATLISQPLIAQYVNHYAVLVRPCKLPKTTAPEVQDSSVLLLFKLVGELLLNAVPGVADARTIQLLTIANYRTPTHLAIYTGVRVLIAGFAIVLSLMASVGNPMVLLLAAPMGIIAWLLPNFFLVRRAKKRQQRILQELPTVIELLVVCAQAGLSLMGALDKVSKEVFDSCPILCYEMQQLISDVKVFAKSAASGFQEMADRCCVDELSNLAGALLAAETKGADLSYPLKQQAEAVRTRLKRKREEEASTVPVKMVPVIMIFIMPLILFPMLGPAIFLIMKVFIDIGGKH